MAIDKSFRLVKTDTVSLSVDLSAWPQTEGYVSLCHWKDPVNPVALNYEDCLTRGRVSGGYFETDISVPPHVTSLGAAVWFFDESLRPLTVSFERSEWQDGQLLIY